MCMDAKRKDHICGFCIKLKSLLRIHLRQVYYSANTSQSSKSPTKLSFKYARKRRSAGRINSELEQQWKRLHSVYIKCIKLEQEDAPLDDPEPRLPPSIEAVQLNQSSDATTEQTPAPPSKSIEFECDIAGCGKVFKSRLQFRRHQTSHDTDRKYSCTECEARFRQEIHLNEHMLSHSKERPHECPCGKSFQTARQLRRHRFRNESHECLVYEPDSDTEVNESSSPIKFEPDADYEKNIDSEKRRSQNVQRKFSKKKRRQVKISTFKFFCCTQCGKTFDSKSRFELHRKKHEKDTPYSCDHENCNESFTSKRKLKTHMFTHDVKQHDCKVCPLKFNSESELFEHMFVHSKSGHAPFMCFCGKYFLCAAKLKEHKVVHEDARPYVCEICNKGFKRAINLKEHMYIHQEVKPFVCRCGKKFAAAPLLKRHQNRDHKTSVKDKPTSKFNTHTCELCDATFRRRVFLYKHMKEHVKDVFTCEQCQNQFPSQDELAAHICGDQSANSGSTTRQDFLSPEEYEKKVKTFLCELCGKGYANNSKLNEHRKTHTGELPFVCSLCPKSFSEKYKLSNHMITHTTTLEQRRNLPCEYCGRMFTSKVGLVNHIRTHTGEKPHKCPHCDYRSTQYSGMQSHLATHSDKRNFECKICNKRFKLKWSLVLHTKRHAGETKHECPVCTKRFLTTSQLKKHSYVHSEVRPFQCQLCGAAFKRNEALKSHMERHTSEQRLTLKSAANLNANQQLQHGNSAITPNHPQTSQTIQLHISEPKQQVGFQTSHHQQPFENQQLFVVQEDKNNQIQIQKHDVQTQQTIHALTNMDVMQFQQYFAPANKTNLG